MAAIISETVVFGGTSALQMNDLIGVSCVHSLWSFHILNYLNPADLWASQVVKYPPANVGVAGDAGNRIQSLGQEDPLEKETATHSSILSWEIPWIEEPGGLQSIGSKESGTSPADQWLSLCVSTAEGPGSIPSWGMKFPHTAGCSQKEKKKSDMT